MKASIHHVSLPMKRSFGHAKATRQVAESVVFCLERDGFEGAGECVPREYVTGETTNSVFAALRSLDLESLLANIDTSCYGIAVPLIEALDLPKRLQRGERPGLAAACCLELALLDLVGRRSATSIRETAGACHLPEALTNGAGVHLPFTRAVDAGSTPESIFLEGRERFGVLKIKVGLGQELDVARVRAARALGGPELTISVDANMAWSLDEACRMADVLRPFAIAWYEEPLAKGALRDYAHLRERAGIAVMLDESLCSRDDAQAAIDLGACDLFNIRLSKCGGFIASLRLAELALRHGLGYQLGTHPGSQGILRAAEWQMAQTLGSFVAVEAASSGSWVDDEIIREELEIDFAEHRVVPLHGPGLGVNTIRERLERYTVEGSSWCSENNAWIKPNEEAR